MTSEDRLAEAGAQLSPGFRTPGCETLFGREYEAVFKKHNQSFIHLSFRLSFPIGVRWSEV